jgi:hypothetical protein
MAEFGQVAVIVPAAGRGERLGPGAPKALRFLDGSPMLLHAVRALAASRAVDHIVVAPQRHESRNSDEYFSSRFTHPKKFADCFLIIFHMFHHIKGTNTIKSVIGIGKLGDRTLIDLHFQYIMAKAIGGLIIFDGLHNAKGFQHFRRPAGCSTYIQYLQWCTFVY